MKYQIRYYSEMLNAQALLSEHRNLEDANREMSKQRTRFLAHGNARQASTLEIRSNERQN